MSRTKTRSGKAELLARHSYISELAELNRIAENWSTVDREVHVFRVPSYRPDGAPVVQCQPTGTILTVIARAGDPDLLALRDAASDLDKTGIAGAYLRLAERVQHAQTQAAQIDLANVHGIVDLVYGERTIIRNAVVDAAGGFNIFQIEFDGSGVDLEAFRIVEHQVRADAEPLTAVLLVKERELTPIEREAERIAPSHRGVAIQPGPRASFIDAVGNAFKEAGEGVANAVVHVPQAVEILACVNNPNAANQGDADEQFLAQQVAEKAEQRSLAETLAETAEIGFGLSHELAAAGSGTTMRASADVDALLAYRARVLAR